MVTIRPLFETNLYICVLAHTWYCMIRHWMDVIFSPVFVRESSVDIEILLLLLLQSIVRESFCVLSSAQPIQWTHGTLTYVYLSIYIMCGVFLYTHTIYVCMWHCVCLCAYEYIWACRMWVCLCCTVPQFKWTNVFFCANICRCVNVCAERASNGVIPPF